MSNIFPVHVTAAPSRAKRLEEREAHLSVAASTELPSVGLIDCHCLRPNMPSGRIRSRVPPSTTCQHQCTSRRTCYLPCTAQYFTKNFGNSLISLLHRSLALQSSKVKEQLRRDLLQILNLSPVSYTSRTNPQTDLTSRNPLPFSTAALAIASLTNTSKYFPTAAFASFEILVESLVKNS